MADQKENLGHLNDEQLKQREQDKQQADKPKLKPQLGLKQPVTPASKTTETTNTSDAGTSNAKDVA